MTTTEGTTTMTATFHVGDELSCRSLGDWDCVYRFTVIARTAKFVTLRYYDETHRVGIRTNEDGEYCHPLGTYSMCPTLRATPAI